MRNPPIDDLVELRARAAAIVLLTSRDDLRVIQNPRETGLDLTVSLVREGQSTFRQLGVLLSGHKKSFLTFTEASRSLKSILKQRSIIEPGLMPVCVFSFAMTGRSAFYAWRFEPLIGQDGPKLRLMEEFKCQELDQSALAKIIKQVDEYYDALLSSIVES